AGGDVGHRLSEDVWALLIEQTGSLAGFARGFVDRLRLFTAFDFAFNRAVADDHRHVVYGRRLRQREDVKGLDLFPERIVKFLRDGDAGERAADFGFDVGVFERALGARLAITAHHLQRALRDFAWRGLDHAGIARGAEGDKCGRDGQKTRRRAD